MASPIWLLTMHQRLTVATVAPVSVLLALACEVAHLVALVALLAVATEVAAATATTGVTATGAITTGSGAADGRAILLAFAGEVADAVALVASRSRHFLWIGSSWKQIIRKKT